MLKDVFALQAEKALSSAGGGFSFFGGREEKYQNACDLFVEAANALRMAKMSTFQA
jgi:alpha-soluble NSF attachment protein